jgi:hypothetical protein
MSRVYWFLEWDPFSRNVRSDQPGIGHCRGTTRFSWAGGNGVTPLKWYFDHPVKEKDETCDLGEWRYGYGSRDFRTEGDGIRVS